MCKYREKFIALSLPLNSTQQGSTGPPFLCITTSLPVLAFSTVDALCFVCARTLLTSHTLLFRLYTSP